LGRALNRRAAKRAGAPPLSRAAIERSEPPGD
jgi:hypothetical protein